jgi:branched-chain amino acid transport system substrate-binding protein
MCARFGLVLLAAATLVLGAGCGSSKVEPFRIGILSDCYGPFSSVHEVIVASAELPLLERGGRLRGKQPSSGVEGAEVAGRPAELVIGCVAGNEDVIPEARRLVEEDGAEAVVGPLDPQQGMVLREYARRRPATASLIEPSGAPEVTLTDPAPNVFRFTVDAAQWVAGAGTYAYRTLGWRAAAVVGDDAPFSWAGVSGFVAEFCALGGRIVDRSWITVGTDPAGILPKIPRMADGVFLAPTVSPMLSLVKAYAALHPDLSRRLIVSSTVLYDPNVIPTLMGVVGAGSLPFAPTAALAPYVAAWKKTFPTIPPAVAIGPITIPYRDGVEALLEALARSGGATGTPLLRALARVQLNSPAGRIQLDAHRQAVAPGYLSRVGKAGIETVRVVPRVEQTFGGYFRPGDPPPSRTSPACKHGNPPPWAR